MPHRMNRAYYSSSINDFVRTSTDEILGRLSRGNEFALVQTQRDAWLAQIEILRTSLLPYAGSVYFEYSIPRMGRRIDVLVVIGPVIFVVEFKVGESEFSAHAIDQVFDYALDLKNFHEASHAQFIAPVLIATKAANASPIVATTPQNDRLLFPIKTDVEQFGSVIELALKFVDGSDIDVAEWERGRYCPTPTIIEAAMALYNDHSVANITRSDAGATNLTLTSHAVSEIIRQSKSQFTEVNLPGSSGCGIRRANQ